MEKKWYQQRLQVGVIVALLGGFFAILSAMIHAGKLGFGSSSPSGPTTRQLEATDWAALPYEQLLTRYRDASVQDGREIRRALIGKEVSWTGHFARWNEWSGTLVTLSEVSGVAPPPTYASAFDRWIATPITSPG